jgi:hypothetical protein
MKQDTCEVCFKMQIGFVENGMIDYNINWSGQQIVVKLSNIKFQQFIVVRQIQHPICIHFLHFAQRLHKINALLHSRKGA